VDTKQLQTIFGASIKESNSVKRYHFVLYFKNHTDLDSKSQEKLQKVLAVMKKVKHPYVKIIGHTDTLSSVQKNYKIGLKRAKHIADMIKHAGIKYMKIDTVSHSELDLAVKTPDNTKEPLNRRVEIFIQ
jgi:outer membrane protein OmpA-like peptidoglycan-associated protein